MDNTTSTNQNFPIYFWDGGFKFFKVSSYNTGILVSTLPGKNKIQEMDEEALLKEMRIYGKNGIDKKKFDEAMERACFMIHSIVATGKKAILLF
jgi:hypothetical protein